jgi:hypothetical protein
MKLSVNLLLPGGRYVKAGTDVDETEVPMYLRALEVRDDPTAEAQESRESQAPAPEKQPKRRFGANPPAAR